MKRFFLFLIVCTLIPKTLCSQQRMTLMFLNSENLFDPEDDPFKDDDDFTPEGIYHWTRSRYWDKLDAVAKVIVAADEDQAPALVGLAEVENETVVNDLTTRSALREAGYRFVMTDSPDRRGIDVALLYRRSYFSLIAQESLRVNLQPYGGGATRDILHVTGLLENYDTLDVYVCHWPSRYGGVDESEPLRLCASRRLRESVDSVFNFRSKPYIVIMGDLNEGPDEPAVRDGLKAQPFSRGAQARDDELITIMDPLEYGSYKYEGEWDKYDQFILSASFTNGLGCTEFMEAGIMDLGFLLTDDDNYGGRKPYRTYNGRRYLGGYSDHLPVKINIGF